jgi:hypothetical protein
MIRNPAVVLYKDAGIKTLIYCIGPESEELQPQQMTIYDTNDIYMSNNGIAPGGFSGGREEGFDGGADNV